MKPDKHLLFDFYALGESVIDVITEEGVNSLAEAGRLRLYVGGQSTNLALNLARLGKRTALSVCLGEDSLGDLILQDLVAAGVNTTYVQRTSEANTTLSMIARHTTTADFVIYRGADAFLVSEQEQQQAIFTSRIVHSSAFSLARQPARSTILTALKNAHHNGCLVTLDPNYHPWIWPDTMAFLDELQSAYQYVDITKPSLDDCNRIFGVKRSPMEYAEMFFEWGPSEVSITMGAEGVMVANANGERYQVSQANVKVADITGAGDAFWTGYLTGWLGGASLLERAQLGQVMAGLKVGVVGPIKEIPPLEDLIQQASQVPYKRL